MPLAQHFYQVRPFPSICFFLGVMSGQEILVKEALDSEQFGKLSADTSKIMLREDRYKQNQKHKRASLKTTKEKKVTPLEGAYRSISHTNNFVL
ncbi:hypothetical protein RJT34_18478 [Clitoria ternatea]|uniref:Uncharacterized protein n=1 Tax=Clitoria ternatea TaxID=43366 RepID=A0AAN9JB59_CLITE